MCRKAVSRYEFKQKVKAIEEMGELTQALSKNFFGEQNLQNVAEEMADVEIMLEQLKMLFEREDGGFRQEIQDFAEYKIERLERRLKKDG